MRYGVIGSRGRQLVLYVRLIPRRSFGIRSDWSVGVGKTTCDMEITDAREVDLCCGGGDLLRGRKGTTARCLLMPAGNFC